MTKKESQEIIKILFSYHKNAKCELNHDTPFQLLIAVILSAQCTDERVNKITKELFKIAKTPEDFDKLSLEILEKHIYSAGFYKNKASNIKKTVKQIIEKYNGIVPNKREELEKLSGVGRKTANVVSSVAFNEDAIAVDTHVFRVSNRIGLVKAKNAYDCEKQLMNLLDKTIWSKTHHVLIFHGRYVCKSQKPKCDICPITSFCRYYKTKNKKEK